jgi:arsenate reductase
MSQVKIIHNPRCSKSRQTLALLEEQGHQPLIIEYLKSPLTLEEIKTLYQQLGLTHVTEMMRTKEAEYKEAGLDSPTTTDEDRFNAMVTYPKLIERPIVVVANKARIGRPPEAVLELF